MNKLALAATVDQYWAIVPEFGAAAAEMFQLNPEPGEPESRTPAETYMHDSRWCDISTRLDDGVVLIELDGPMTKKFYSSTTRGCSTIEIRRALRDAERDPSVSQIVLAIDSPGGSVSGTADLADEVARIKASKPITAWIDGMCASAALWVAAQATTIVANPNTLDIGSIGVFTVLVDSSRYFDEAGVAVHVVSSGGIKGHPAMGVAIPDEVLADVQATIDHIRDRFVEAVAAGRGMDTKAVADLATGHTWPAANAMELGLVDSLGTLDAVLSGFSLDSAPAALSGDGEEDKIEMSIFSRFFRSAPEATVDPAESQLVAVTVGLAESYVESQRLALADKLTPEREATFVTALSRAIAADGGGQPVINNGRIFVGEMTESVLAMANCWAPPVEPDAAQIASMPGVQVVGDATRAADMDRRIADASGIAKTAVKAEDLK